MSAWQGNMLTSHVAADNVSPDSLSFSGLVSIQGQSMLPSPNHAKYYQESKQNPEFEFSSTKPDLNSTVDTIKIIPADLLISNGQLQPQAFSSQSLIRNQSSSLGSLLATHSSSKKSSGKTGSVMKHQEQHSKASRHKTNESTARRRFGQKMKCFLSPCRDSQAIKPTVAKAQTIPEI
ncbi:hypothetical protein HN51_063051 [Arachis hypogaea]|uniref:Uncharacterized protein n=1 Tax=Arachis hypogaea TaxID=3818 RepID=A0A445AZK4_ARAHY|nr:hypothetical protein Ahy_B01g056813 [Arachis hypogaea]